MATRAMFRLALLLISGVVAVFPAQSAPEPRADAEPPGPAAVSESLPTPDRLEASNYSLVPHDRAAETCMTDAGEPNGEDPSVSAMRGEERSPVPAGVGVGSCDVLVVASLAPAEYFSDPEQDFLTRLSMLTESTANFFDATHVTPTLEDLLPYEMVIVFTSDYWNDRYQTGDVLADYVEAGGKVILGAYTHHTEGAGDWLEGRIMEQYNPAFIDDSRWRSSYTGDGMDCIFNDVPTFLTLPYDHIESLIGSAGSDGTYEDGSSAAAYRLDRSVYYVPGHMGGFLSTIVDPPATEAWVQLTANICYCEPEALSGTCCDPFEGTCEDSALAADCQPPFLFTEGATCASLDPPCGNPGSCCDDSTGGCTQQPERKCAGRFEAGATCASDPFVPACGETGTCDILYAPANDDNPRLRADIALITASNVDYFDARLGTPGPARLAQYETVLTWVNSPYHDAVGMGNSLADYVETGGRVILGLWSAPGGNNYNYLDGRLMEEYSPVTIGGLDWGGTSYADDGVDCIHDNVSHYSPRIWDKIAEVAPDSWSDGTYVNLAGDQYPSVAYRHDRKVTYISGFDARHGGPGDWAQLIANICSCPTVDVFGACCDATSGTCTDDVLATECLPPLQWTHDAQCAELSPQCGNPGACCDDAGDGCRQGIELACEGRFRPGQTCESQPFDPPCGDYEPCMHSIVMRDDVGIGWTGNSIDVYVGGFPVLTGVTLQDGTGPESVFFPAEEDETITTVWTAVNVWTRQVSYCIAGADGTSLGCDGVNDEIPTGITVNGDCTELVCGDGICQLGGGENCANCRQDCGDCGCISQASVQGRAYFSDLDCQSCNFGEGGLQVMADNFQTFEETQVLGLRFWGAYVPDEITSEPDRITVVFREFAGDRPGAVIASYGPLAGTRTLIGNNEYEYFIAVDETLPAGRYWLEVYNDTSDTQDSWAWYEGTSDPAYGLFGSASSGEIPENWVFTGLADVAFDLVCAADVTITLDKSGDDSRVHWNSVAGYTYDVLHAPMGESTWTREENVLPPWHHVGAFLDVNQDYKYRVEAVPVIPPAP